MADIGVRSGNAALTLMIGRDFLMGPRTRIAAHVEFKNSGNHDGSLRSISVLGTRETERRIAINEKAAVNSLLVLNHPVSPVVLANHEMRWPQPRGRLGLLCLCHRRSP